MLRAEFLWYGEDKSQECGICRDWAEEFVEAKVRLWGTGLRILGTKIAGIGVVG